MYTMPRLYRRKAVSTKPRAMKPKRKAYKRPLRKGAPRYARKPRVNRYRSAAGAFTNSLFKWMLQRPTARVKALKRVGTPDIFQINQGTDISPNVGYQLFRDYFALNVPRLKQLAATVPGGAGDTQPNLKRFIVENVQTELTLTNQSNAAAEIEIYDIVCRRDVDASWTITTGGNTYIAAGQPSSYVEIGCDIASGALPTSGQEQIIGASPYDSQLFKDYFRVVRKTHVMLLSGGTHRHSAQHMVNGIVETALLNDNTAMLKGLTIGSMLCVRGVAAINMGPEGSPLTTSNNPKINVLYNERVKFTWVADSTQTVYYHDNLPHSASTDVEVRNIGSGALENPSPL